MHVICLAAAGVASLAIGCSSETPPVDHSVRTVGDDTTNMGVVAHNQVVMAPIDSSRFAALTFAYGRIDVIDWIAGTRAELQRPPGCATPPGPISLVATDWTADGVADLLVFDPECGSWSARSEGDQYVVDAGWPASLDVSFFGPQAVGGLWGGTPTVIAPRDRSVVMYRYDGAKKDWSLTSWTTDGLNSSEVITSELYLRPATNEAPLTSLAFQELRAIAILDTELRFKERLREIHTDEFIEKLGYDHFLEIPSQANCSAFAIGIPFYDSKASRRSFLLERRDNGYIASRLPFVHPLVSQVVYAPEAGTSYVMAITREENGTTHLEVLRLTGCNTTTMWIDVIVDAHLADATSVVNGVSFVPLKDTTARWVVVPSQTGATMLNYDGTELRVLSVDLGVRSAELKKTPL